MLKIYLSVGKLVGGFDQTILTSELAIEQSGS